MNDTLIGIVTFSNLKYTKLAIEGDKESSKQFDLFVIIGNPNDNETQPYLESQNIPFMKHNRNNGFPASLNDIYDHFIRHNYKYLIIQGNDVIPYPYAIDNLIAIARQGVYDWVGAREVNVKGLINDYPEIKEYFSGNNLTCTNFDIKPWNVFTGYNDKLEIDGAGLADCQNLNLYTRRAIDILGYTDVNFYPNGYYNDNDYVKRAIELNVPSCTSANSYYFHFWSRTLKEVRKDNRHFGMNERFYIEKWGGSPGHEKFSIPFNGNEKRLYNETNAPNTLKIGSRSFEWSIIDYWSSK